MGIVEIILIGIGLGMDAFAVAVCKGLSMAKMNWKKRGYYWTLFWCIPSGNAYNRLLFREKF